MKRLTNTIRINAIAFAGNNKVIYAAGDMDTTMAEFITKAKEIDGEPTGIEKMLDLNYTLQTKYKSGRHGEGKETLECYVSNEKHNGKVAQFVEIVE